MIFGWVQRGRVQCECVQCGWGMGGYNVGGVSPVRNYLHGSYGWRQVNCDFWLNNLFQEFKMFMFDKLLFWSPSFPSICGDSSTSCWNNGIIPVKQYPCCFVIFCLFYSSLTFDPHQHLQNISPLKTHICSFLYETMSAEPFLQLWCIFTHFFYLSYVNV